MSCTALNCLKNGRCKSIRSPGPKKLKTDLLCLGRLQAVDRFPKFNPESEFEAFQERLLILISRGATDVGMKRLTLTDSDKKVRDWFVKTTESLGCKVSVDAMGRPRTRASSKI